MDKQFDELSKSLAEGGISRREALRKFGFGLAGVLLASLGIAGPVRAAGCIDSSDCPSHHLCCNGQCVPENNNQNCGGCGNRCPKGTSCKSINGFGYACV